LGSPPAAHSGETFDQNAAALVRFDFAYLRDSPSARILSALGAPEKIDTVPD
jgi:hypothetical protein